jgi:glutamyl-tRNA synthetase
VVRRADGSWLYMLPSVVDDIDMGVTHVIRGEDHVTNTGIQLQMFEALGAAAPQFGHAPLLTGGEGKLSKRLGSVGVDDFRGEGIEPIAVKALLARIGTSLPVEPVVDDKPLIDGFDLAQLGRATPRFDEAELRQLNSRIIHMLPHASVAGRIRLSPAQWEAVRGNLDAVAEADSWLPVFDNTLDGQALEDEDARGLAAAAAELLPQLSFDDAIWAALTTRLKQETGRAGKALFLPLRRALTGRDHGPDMALLLPLIGRDAAIARLRRAAGS